MPASASTSTAPRPECACLGHERGDSPLCPHSPERGASQPCVREDSQLIDAQIIDSVRSLFRRKGWLELQAGQAINRQDYDLEWFDRPGYEWESIYLELQVVESMLLEMKLRELDRLDAGLPEVA